MKKEMYKMSKEENLVKCIESLYEKMLSGNEDEGSRERLVKDILKLQAEDGFFSATEWRRGDSDFLVYYIYRPTYLATAALMYADLCNTFKKNSKEYKALCAGLMLATRRGLQGHGYEATESALDSLNIYKRAGLYEWIQKNEKTAPEFCQMIHKIIKNYRERLDSGRTVSDWARDFSKEFQKEVEDYDASIMTYVWYVAYGSNVNTERFMHYIENCYDKTAPLEEKPYILSHNIYFASESRIWDNKGTAFLDDSKTGMAYGKAYKITRAQFLEIKRQEGAKYNKQLILGNLEGIPVYTFTAPLPYKVQKEPSLLYMKTIRDGLKKTYPEMSDNFIDIYLYSRNVLTKDDISVLSFIRHSKHGVSIEQITKSRVPMTRVKVSVKRLKNLELIKQDSRNIRAGHEATDKGAIYYTRKEKREIVDVVLLFSEKHANQKAIY